MFWFRLAELWGCTVREAQARCDSREFAEWVAFDQLNPFGQHRVLVLLSELCAMFFNANTDDKTRKLRPADFMPYMKIPKQKPQTVDQQKDNLELIARAMGMKH